MKLKNTTGICCQLVVKMCNGFSSLSLPGQRYRLFPAKSSALPKLRAAMTSYILFGDAMNLDVVAGNSVRRESISVKPTPTLNVM